MLLCILLMTAGIFFTIFSFHSQKKDCIILQNHAILKVVPLDSHTSEEFIVSGAYENHIEIKKGKVRMHSSDCPNQVCVSSGWISRPGQTIICLPNRVMIKIVSDRESEVDAIVS